MSVGSIAAVIVTYNRCELLERVLVALSRQTRMPDCIMIIDNASTDKTSAVVAKCAGEMGLNIDYVRLDKNTGGAGGFFEGAKKAYEDGYEALWFMDDDTIPQPDALLSLESDLMRFESGTGYSPAFICSTVLWKNDDLCEMNIPEPIWDWPRFIDGKHDVALVGSCSFVSVLIRRQKIRICGYPVKDFFIWYDDVEFTKRLASSGYPGIMSFASRVNHWLPDNKGVNYEMITDKTAWKYRYGIRNQGAVILKTQGWWRFMYFGFVSLKAAFRGNLSFGMKMGLLRSFLSGMKFRYSIISPSE